MRKNTVNRKINEGRERIKSANSEATETKKLCNRTKSALSYLLNCRNVSTIYEALKNLGEFEEDVLLGQYTAINRATRRLILHSYLQVKPA